MQELIEQIEAVREKLLAMREKDSRAQLIGAISGLSGALDNLRWLGSAGTADATVARATVADVALN